MLNRSFSLLSLTFFAVITSSSLSGQENLSEPFERAQNKRQPPEIVLPAIGVKKGMTIGEIGAGRGRYTVFLSKAAGPTGRVFANDIEEASLSYLKGRCRRLGLTNVSTITGETDDSRFPENSLDLAIMVLVYHMIESPDKLLENLKNSMKKGSTLVIVDPVDRLIDEEFGIDRSKAGNMSPTIRQRIEKSAANAGYELVKTDTILPDDYIFFLRPVFNKPKIPAGELLGTIMITRGIEAAKKEFSIIRNRHEDFDFSEKEFLNKGNEFIGAHNYPEAVAIMTMGISLYPKSSSLNGALGEVYVISGEKENARSAYRQFMINGPDSLSTDMMMQNFDNMYEMMRSMLR